MVSLVFCGLLYSHEVRGDGASEGSTVNLQDAVWWHAVW